MRATGITMSDGARLWTCSSADPARPGLVLLHGGPGPWDYLGPVAALAAGSFRTHPPTATSTEVDGAGHHPWCERPDAVRALLAELPAGG